MPSIITATTTTHAVAVYVRPIKIKIKKKERENELIEKISVSPLFVVRLPTSLDPCKVDRLRQ